MALTWWEDLTEAIKIEALVRTVVTQFLGKRNRQQEEEKEKKKRETGKKLGRIRMV